MGAGTLRVVLFDLDGTLVHTAPDITVALNSALAEHQLPTFEQAQVRGWIGRGPQVLVQRALPAAGSFASRMDIPARDRKRVA